MKKASFLLILPVVAVFSCGKNNNTAIPSTPIIEKYMSTTAGSTWNYETVDSVSLISAGYKLTSTSRDTNVLSKSYHVYINSGTSGSEYYNITGGDYYSFQNLPSEIGGSRAENLYLKTDAAVNTAWTQNYPIVVSGASITVTITNKIKETGLTKTVNGILYSNVIHVESSLSATGIPPASLTSDIQSYYAPKVGLIENTTKINLNFIVVSKTNTLLRIKTSNIL